MSLTAQDVLAGAHCSISVAERRVYLEDGESLAVVGAHGRLDIDHFDPKLPLGDLDEILLENAAILVDFLPSAVVASIDLLP